MSNRDQPSREQLERELATARMQTAHLAEELDRRTKLMLMGGAGIGLLLLLRSGSGGGDGDGDGSDSPETADYDTSDRQSFMSDCLSANGGDMAKCCELWKAVDG